MKEFSLTEKSLDRFHALYYDKTTRSKNSKVFWPPLGIVCLVVSVLEQTGIYRVSPNVNLASMLAIFGLIFLVLPFALPALAAGAARKAFRARPTLLDPVMVSWTHDHVKYVSKSWSATQSWSDFGSWAEGEVGFVLIQGPTFHVIPREILTDTETLEIRTLLKNSVRETSGLAA